MALFGKEKLNILPILFSVVLAVSIPYVFNEIRIQSNNDYLRFFIYPTNSIIYIAWSSVFLIGSIFLSFHFFKRFMKEKNNKGNENFIEFLFVIIIALLPMSAYFSWRIICIFSPLCNFSQMNNILTFYAILIAAHISSLIILYSIHKFKKENIFSGVVLLVIFFLFIFTIWFFITSETPKSDEYTNCTCEELFRSCLCNESNKDEDGRYTNCKCKSTDDKWMIYRSCDCGSFSP